MKHKRQKITGSWKAMGSSSSITFQESIQDGLNSKVLVSKSPSSLFKKTDKEEADKAIVRSIVNDNLPFNLLRSPFFRDVVTAVSKVGPGYEAPSSESARTKFLELLKLEADEHVTGMRDAWKTSGCTIMSDGWTDGRNRPYLNLLVSCPKGVVFLKSLCTTGHKKDAKYICDFVSSAIEDIGPSNVIQFISDNASNYLAAGNLLVEKYPHIFKINCAAHCINLMFKEFDELDYVSPLLDSARKIVNFIYRYQHVLEVMRAHTNGRELKRPGATRFATQFICLQSILKEEQPLRCMVASSEWKELGPCKSAEGVEVQEIILSNSFWEHGRVLILAMEPLFKILRMVDGDGSTCGYIYYALHKVKEAMRQIFADEKARYLPFWKIIDDRWKKSLYSDIHAAAFFLNPHIFYDGHAKYTPKIKAALNKVVSKMLTSEEKDKVSKEVMRYNDKDPDIFGPMAIESLHVAHPRIWWDMWGGAVPVLQKVAIKILSQTCSASACERNWSAFEATLTKKRNRLDPKRLQDLVYVRVNTNLRRTMQKKEQLDSVPIDLDKLDPDVTCIFYEDGDDPIHDDDQQDNEDGSGDIGDHEGGEDDCDNKENILSGDFEFLTGI